MVDSPNPERRDASPSRVSVVMPCFNAERYLEQAVRSVMDQTLHGVELIVVDDGSSDQSPRIVSRLQAEFGDRIVHASQANAGPYAARNHGLRLARGAFVAFLDSDDWWAPDCLEKLHAALLADADAALAYCGWQNIGLEGGRGAPYVPPDYELEDKATRFLRAAAPWPIHAALVRRSVIDEVGGFDLDLPTCMDYDLWLRIAVARPIRLVPEVLAFYRHHQSGQITSTQWRQARNSWLVKRKFVRQHPQLVRHLSRGALKDLIDGSLLRRGYDNFWRRDLESAQRIFRMSLVKGGWRAKDLVYLLPSLLPPALYRKVVLSRDRGPAS
jgi:glycosyltransferase involved in cell wall biosynthesis